MSAPSFNVFASSEELATDLAHNIAERLRTGVAENGTATLVVSGGSTPVKFFHALSGIDLAWDKVEVLLADERWVPPSSERSNAALVRTHLLQNKAAQALFKPVYDENLTAAEGARALSAEMEKKGKPFDAVILGMGTDGHTASLFPDAPEISDALQAGAEPAMVFTPVSQPEVRITLTPEALTRTRYLVLHIEGVSKREVYDAAMTTGAWEEMPVRAILHNDKTQVQVYWCA